MAMHYSVILSEDSFGLILCVTHITLRLVNLLDRSSAECFKNFGIRKILNSSQCDKFGSGKMF